MPSGVIIRGQDGSVQRVPFEQLQQSDPFLYSQYVKNVAQPNAQLSETQASTGAAGASAASSIESAKNSRLNQQETQHNLDIIKFLSDTKGYFDKNKGSDQKVSPQDYNAKKQEASGLGVPSDTFDKTFEQSYTNPQNYNYDTPTNFDKKTAYQQTKNALQAQIEGYNAIPEDQKGLFSKDIFTKLPGPLGQMLAPQATEYQNQLKGLSAKLSDIAGGGQGSGLRITQTELNNWATLMPTPNKTKTQNEYDLKQLNRLMEAKFGKGNGIDSQYLPGGGGQTNQRPSLDSFNQ